MTTPQRRSYGAATQDADALIERKREQACAGEVSRTRQLLTVAELAPGNDASWRALTDPVRRRLSWRINLPGPSNSDPAATAVGAGHAKHLKILYRHARSRAPRFRSDATGE